MWSTEKRRRRDRSRQGCPGALTDAGWQLIAPLIPPARRSGNKRTVDVRQVLNDLMHSLSTGCQWRCLPKDYPPESTVFPYFDLWNLDGTLLAIHDAPVALCREQAGREVAPELCHHRQSKRQER